MDINTLKMIFDNYYQFNIRKKDRKRYKVYARKMYCYTARQLGHTYESIGETIDIKHDNLIYYINTLNSVTKKDKEIYNRIAKDYNLPIKMFQTELKETQKEKVLNKSNQFLKQFNELLELNDSEITEFRETRLKPFLAMLKSRKTHKNITNVAGATIKR